ncbi:type II secretion system protein GspK [Halobacteriovorax sp. GB3]|uniref:type II secretion system protein GspK n=1 Tax=Halobacteriovorax sp. GB3 TaxID=2719615 RepID=UPI0023629B0A|nr:type II secretion system protein GspK [Halobacteriovorax sp. GB3]MDD0852295.1 type II secretion system protein GspK [Halobacteriovorax sp. GB3]
MKNTRKNQEGFTLVIVLISLVTLTFLSMEIMTLNEWNSYKGYNIVDKAQAKLNAESGINVSLAKLRVYKEAWNLLEKNPSIKKVIPPSTAEKMVTYPFVYPIPIPDGANVIQKQAIGKFEEDSLLSPNSGITLSMQSISGFLNPNLLRIPKKDENESDKNSQNSQDDDGESDKESPQVLIEKKLISTLESLIKNKSETSERFATKFANIRPTLLIKELKFFVNEPGDFKDVELGEIEPLYSSYNITPKHAPLSSLEELHLLQGWDDELIELIKPRLSVNEVTFIQLNNITAGDLKVIFPSITDDQVKEFFKYRDGDPEKEIEPSPFKNIEEFKQALVEKLGIVDSSTFDKRIKELNDAGLKLGVAGKLFKVTSTGKSNETTYTIEAIIDLPVKPKPISKDNKNSSSKTQTNKTDLVNQDNDQDQSQTNNNSNKSGEEKEEVFLMEPRVVDLRVI